MEVENYKRIEFSIPDDLSKVVDDVRKVHAPVHGCPKELLESSLSNSIDTIKKPI